MNTKELRILELSDESYFHLWAQGHRVESYFVGCRPASSSVPSLTLRRGIQLRRRLRLGEFDLVAITMAPVALWKGEAPWWKNIANGICRLVRTPHLFGLNYFGLIYGKSTTPVLFYSRKDHPMIPARNFKNLKLSQKIFIRELPQNRWNLFLNTGPKNEDVINIQRNQLIASFLPKIRPLALGLATEPVLIPIGSVEKKMDLFYAGKNHTSTVRSQGRAWVQKLKESGFRVDFPEGYLSQEEYNRRLSAAWLVWSPEGQGWDCYRHYEALALGTVPVVNYPTIERDHPLIDRRHLFFYSIEGDHILEVIHAALHDRPQLSRMAQAGQDHLMKYHLPTLIVQRMIEATLTDGQ